MINFNQKFVIAGGGQAGTASPTWFDEMLSAMAEDLMASVLNTNPTIWDVRMPDLFRDFTSNSLTAWGHMLAPFVLRNYGEKYAFGAYFLRNYGGAEFIKSLMFNNKVGVESLDLALQDVAGVTFSEAFGRVGEAFIFSGFNLPEDVNTFDKTFISTVGDFTYELLPFDVWRRYGGLMSDNLYTISGAMGSTLSSGYKVTIETPEIWREQELTGNLSVTITKPDDGVKLYLLVK
jgi:hypothetical protein